ncbi:uncharacterized protein LOC130647506 isoform X2 [Hydractinia symbiolongicarpus]|nr:uncharacterized protein LOC130647506 isoform X2 [Hydractinia symbiolongicarpus]
MICIKKDFVKDFRVNVTDEKTILLLKLHEPACNLAPFCPDAPEHYVKIIFDCKCDISNAVKMLFGEIKYVELPISSPSVSSTPSRYGIKRVSSAISPLTVHQTSSQSSEDQQISDETVSSSSAAVVPNTLISNKSESADDEKAEKTVNKSVEADEKPPLIVPESQEIVESTTDEKKKASKHNKNVNSRQKEDNVDFQIDLRQTQELSKEEKKPLKSESKKGKKLLSTNVIVFQDSPDLNYEPKPVVAPSKKKQQHRKPSKKKTKSIGKSNHSEKELAAFDFTMTEEEEENKELPSDSSMLKPSRQANPKAKSKSKKKSNTNKQKDIKTTLKESLSSNDEQDESKLHSKPKRPTRAANKKVLYTELNSDTEDFEERKNTSDVAKEIEVVSSLKKNRSKGRKSVSFISPVEETSYFEVEPDYNETEAELENTNNMDEVIEIESGNTSKNIVEFPPDDSQSEVTVFGNVLLQEQQIDQEPSQEKTNEQASSSTHDNLSEKSAKLKSGKAVKKSVKTKRKEEIYEILPKKEVKPFERNLQIGWGKKGKLPASDVYDFPSSDEDSQVNTKKKRSKKEEPTYMETPWSQQKAKKKRVKQKYNINKKKTYKNEVNCVDDESGSENSSHKEERSYCCEGSEEEKKGRRVNSKKMKEKRVRERPERARSVKTVTRNSVNEKNSPAGSFSPKEDEIVSPITESFEVADDRSLSSSSQESTNSSNRNKSSENKIKIKKSTPSFNGSVKGKRKSPQSSVESSQELSSVEGSQEQQFFNETPMTVTRSGVKKWVQDLNQVFENIEEATSKKPRKKLWKSPVVILNDELEKTLNSPTTPSLDPVSPHPASASNRSTPKPHTPSQVTRKLLKKEIHMKSVSPAPVMEVDGDDDLSNGDFADFCKNILNQSSKGSYCNIDNKSHNSPVVEEQRAEIVKSPEVKKRKLLSKPLQRKQYEVVEDEAPARVVFEEKVSKVGRRLEERLSSYVLSIGETPNTSLMDDRANVLPTQDSVDLDDENVQLDYPTIDSHEIMKKYMCSSRCSEQNNEEDESDSDEYNSHHNQVDISAVRDTVGDEIHDVLKSFGANINKTLNQKRNGIDKFISKVNKLMERKMHSVWNDQRELRQDVDSVFHESWLKELEEWYSGCQHKEKKLSNILSQLKVTLEEQSDDDKKRIKRMKQTHQMYFEQKKKVIQQERQLQNAVQENLRHDIKKLRNQMLHQSKSLEMANIRRSLQSMLNNV